MFDMVWNREEITEIHLTEVEELLDENGFKTGEKLKKYSSPVSVFARITPATGKYGDNVFGGFEDYSHIIISAEPLSIVKDSVLYYPAIRPTAGFGYIQFGASNFGDSSPAVEDVYTVKRVAHDLNTYYYALEAVNAEDYPYSA